MVERERDVDGVVMPEMPPTTAGRWKENALLVEMFEIILHIR
jgi:hypothetical protein